MQSVTDCMVITFCAVAIALATCTGKDACSRVVAIYFYSVMLICLKQEHLIKKAAQTPLVSSLIVQLPLSLLTDVLMACRMACYTLSLVP